MSTASLSLDQIGLAIGAPVWPKGCAYVPPHARHCLEAAAVPQAMLAGHAILTALNTDTGVRYTYQLVRGKDTSRGVVSFVKGLTGPDNTSQYTMFGLIRDGVYSLWRRSTLSEEAPSVKAFARLWAKRHRLAEWPQIEVWHEGRCLRCGRRLTTPESIARSFGPECADIIASDMRKTA